MGLDRPDPEPKPLLDRGRVRTGEDGAPEQEAMPVVEQRIVDEEHQVGRNDPCWCGSGKKFKKCHGA